MGTVQSHENSLADASSQPKVVRIERNEVPEEYRTVGVSHDIVDRILKLDGMEDENTSNLKRELAQERETNLKLREQIRQLTESKFAPPQSESGNLSLVELEERTKAFEEALKRIEKQYFSYHPENVCRTNETDVMECIKKNRNKLLNCASFAVDLKKCAGDFREKVLKEMSHL